MAGFMVQPRKIAIGVGFKWFARFLDTPNLQFKKKFHHTVEISPPTAGVGNRQSTASHIDCIIFIAGHIYY